MLFSLAVKELKNHLYFSVLFVVHLSVGLSGLSALGIFKNSLNQTLNRHSKEIMGADLSITSKRPMTPEEKRIVEKEIPSHSKQSTLVQMYSMAVSPSGSSRLVHIKGIERNYPFYGAIDLGKQPADNGPNLHDDLAIWVDSQILWQLNVEKGDFLRIGSGSFRISGVVQSDPAGFFTRSVAPVVYISKTHLQQAQLIRPGSLIQYSYLYQISSSDSQLEKIGENLFSTLKDPQFQIKTHIHSSETTGKLMSYAGDFLSLSALAVLFLACVGMGFLFHSYLRSKVYESAVLNALGMNQSKIIILYLIQVLILSLISFVLTALLGGLIFYFLKFLAVDLLPFDLHWSFHFIGVNLFLSFFTPIAITLPLIMSIRKIKISVLLSGNIPFQKDWKIFLFFIPGSFILWALSVWQSSSLFIGTVFTALFLSSTVVLFLLGWALLKIFGKMNFISLPVLRWAFRDLSRKKAQTISCFLSLSLGSLLIYLIPQIHKDLKKEIAVPKIRPSLFLFDIQEDQVQPLKKLLAQNQVQLKSISPMIQGRLLSVNGEAFDKGTGSHSLQRTREGEREMRFRNRGINLSYRNFLYSHEDIVKGSFWSKASLPKKNQPAGISLEKNFAKRLNLKMGDVLVFNVQNQEVTGRVQNLRKVKWTTFDPNFFILFQDGVLNFAQKTFLSAIAELPHEAKVKIQNKMAREFPNISSVDISKIADQVFFLADRILKSLQFMSLLCLLAGLVVFYSISSYQAGKQRKTLALLKALGVSFGDIRLLFLYQFGLISLGAGVFGWAASMGVSYILSVVFFDSVWSFSFLPAGLMVFGILVLTLLAGYLAVQGFLKTSFRTLFSGS